ncbi:MAG: LuxR family transcriptional regulator [Sphingomonadales bacterium]|nr:MAG: LuxR family transcriptional regulator [Sphingomonadales bacterium]
MLTLDAAERIAGDFTQIDDVAGLDNVLGEICHQLGCEFFALSHHVDFLCAPHAGLRVHNYPEEWAHWFDTQRLGIIDPVHRASQQTSAGFYWRDMVRGRALAPQDRFVFARARRHGIGDGLTIPAHVPGDAHGSCSFAWARGKAPGPGALFFAQSIANFAFETARRLHGPRNPARPRLTDRQRECLLWAARGKTDWEIARIMGIRHFTVVEHIRNARLRYDAATRGMLIVRALFDGTLNFGDIALN